jgi:hypothetical protein
MSTLLFICGQVAKTARVSVRNFEHGSGLHHETRGSGLNDSVLQVDRIESCQSWNILSTLGVTLHQILYGSDDLRIKISCVGVSVYYQSRS